MSLTSDEHQTIKPVDLVFILAIAGRIDAQSRIFAEKLHEDRTIYHAYAVLDSLSSSYSMFKYFFDVFVPDGTNDSMHELMMTPGGIIAICIESVFLVSFSFFAARFENQKDDAMKQLIAKAWPYFRDVMKALKNAYKGFRSAIVAISLIGNVDLKYLITPIGLLLGVFAAANRVWLRFMTDKRNKLMDLNAGQLLKIKKLRSLTVEESKAYLDTPGLSLTERFLVLAAVGAGGFIDGLYLYVGLLGLAALSSPLLTAMAVISGIYTLSCIVTRLYEEYDYQMKLVVAQSRCELAVAAKLLETSFAELWSLTNKANKNFDDITAIRTWQLVVHADIKRFAEKRLQLSQQASRSYLSAILVGLKNGLYAYSALASLLFFVGSFLVLMGISFPPFLLVSCVVFGLVFMACFAAHSVFRAYKQSSSAANEDEKSYKDLIEMKNHLLRGAGDYMEPESFQHSIQDVLYLDPSPQFFFQEWFEVFRSLFSGFGKGQKFVDFAGNPLQEMDEHGHYQDTPIMYVLAVFNALFFSIILALRALAKGLGRPPKGQADKDGMSGREPLNAEVALKTEVLRESSQSNKSLTDSQKSIFTIPSLIGFFSKKPTPSSTLSTPQTSPRASKPATPPRPATPQRPATPSRPSTPSISTKLIKPSIPHIKSENDFSIYAASLQNKVLGLM
ncbi:hypothetical protein [Legionella worsleiensis]|uniref:Transmembrane protein n=1 Tax=Legionella worsleiensis TaxID=45076 RepID=A0A0W1AJQ8_9GAMM|nr:hypothetical protein [Legionella worsleiensis]KTD81569.1 transmembrane protein [Legionella worsleiensis]STY32129.1 transmembrane protein [Legionella worsleiensis]